MLKREIVFALRKAVSAENIVALSSYDILAKMLAACDLATAKRTKVEIEKIMKEGVGHMAKLDGILKEVLESGRTEF